MEDNGIYSALSEMARQGAGERRDHGEDAKVAKAQKLAAALAAIEAKKAEMAANIEAAKDEFANSMASSVGNAAVVVSSVAAAAPGQVESRIAGGIGAAASAVGNLAASAMPGISPAVRQAAAAAASSGAGRFAANVAAHTAERVTEWVAGQPLGGGGHNVVEMDFAAVARASQKYRQLAQECAQIYRALEADSAKLKSNCFTGMVGGAAAEAVLMVLKILIQIRINKYQEIATDLGQSIMARHMGDMNARPNFTTGQGIDLGAS